MTQKKVPSIAIVDMGLGNLHSVKQVCDHVGMNGIITDNPKVISGADAVILPGVGAFGDAMQTLVRKKLTDSLIEGVTAGKPLLGVCLGMQLLMARGTEFGEHTGFGFFKGSVVRFPRPMPGQVLVKVPQIGWNRVFRSPQISIDVWETTPLRQIPDGVFMYFVHSFYVVPEHPKDEIAWSEYGTVKYCSAIRSRNILGVQFHPERSGLWGVRFYQNLKWLIECSM